MRVAIFVLAMLFAATPVATAQTTIEWIALSDTEVSLRGQGCIGVAAASFGPADPAVVDAYECEGEGFSADTWGWAAVFGATPEAFVFATGDGAATARIGQVASGGDVAAAESGLRFAIRDMGQTVVPVPPPVPLGVEGCGFGTVGLDPSGWLCAWIDTPLVLVSAAIPIPPSL